MTLCELFKNCEKAGETRACCNLAVDCPDYERLRARFDCDYELDGKCTLKGIDCTAPEKCRVYSGGRK